MPTSVKDLVAAANAAVPRLPPDQAREKVRSGDALVVDVRDPTEVQQSGKVKGAVNVSRGMLEFRADPESQVPQPGIQPGQDGAALLRLGRPGHARRQDAQGHGV